MLEHGVGALGLAAAAGGGEQVNLRSLVVILAISAFVPLVVGLVRIRIAEAVLLLAGGVVFGPQVLGWIRTDGAITFLTQLGMGFLFFHAGLELDQRAIVGRSGRLAAIGWGSALLIAGAATFVLESTGVVKDLLGVAIALTSTALGTLLPILRDRGELHTRFGRYFMGAGAFGELGPVVAVAVLLGSQRHYVALLALGAFASVGLLLAVIPAHLRTARVDAVVRRGHQSTSQTAIRLIVLLLVALLSVADTFGLDVVLGAFAAGMIVRRYAPPAPESATEPKLEGIAFGVFIPIFFVVSGAQLDVASLAQSPARVLLFLVLLLVARGLPQMLIYRRVFPGVRQRARFGLLVATGLPIIVAITTLQVALGKMLPVNAAALVGAGVLSVLIFPLVANWLDGREPSDKVTPVET